MPGPAEKTCLEQETENEKKKKRSQSSGCCDTIIKKRIHNRNLF